MDRRIHDAVKIVLFYVDNPCLNYVYSYIRSRTTILCVCLESIQAQDVYGIQPPIYSGVDIMKKMIKSLLTLGLPYMIAILLPIMSVMCLSIMLVDSYNDKMLAKQQVNIERAFDGFLQKVKSVETLANSIAKNDAVLDYVYEGFKNSGHSPLDYLKFTNVLKSYLIHNSVKLIYYYDIQQRMIISSEGTCNSAEQFFKSAYQIDGITVDDSVKRLYDSSGNREYSYAIKVAKGNVATALATEVIEYKLFLPMEMTRNHYGQLVIVIDAEEMFSGFYDLLQNNTGEFHVYDRKNRLIYSSGSRFDGLSDALHETSSSDLKLLDHEGEQVYGMTCSSANRFWKVEVYTTKSQKISSMAGLPHKFGLMVVAPVILSFLLCIFFTYKNQKSIQGILMLLRGTDTKKSNEMEYEGYRSIRDQIKQIIDENNSFREQIARNNYSYKNKIIDKLLHKGYATKTDMLKEIAGIELGVTEGACVVLCICCGDSSYKMSISAEVSIKDLVKELLAQVLEQPFELFDTSDLETICVLNISESTDMEFVLRNLISKMNVEIGYLYGIEINVGAGEKVDSLYRLNDSYMQAKAVISYNETYDKKINLYSKLLEMTDIYYYPKNYEDMIYNHIEVGDGEKARKIIEKIYERNFGENTPNLTENAIKTLKNNIWSTFESLAKEYNISLNRIIKDQVLMFSQEEETNEQNIRQYFDTVYCVVDRLVDEVINNKNNKRSQSAIKLMDYVQKHYCDKDLSLKQISIAFDFNESYISNLFKVEYGENLSVVIEKLRIEKAKELINFEELRISEIAEKVGYNSDMSFRRAFKKIMGVTPSEYRGSQKH